MPKPLDPLIVEQMVQEYLAGRPTAEILNTYNVCYPTLRKYISQSGQPVRKQRRLSKQEVQDILSEYATGLYTTDELGVKYGVCGHTVRGHLKAQGVAPGTGQANKKRRLSDREWCARRVRGTYLRGAQERGLVFALTKEQVESLIYKPCVYCGRVGVSTCARTVPDPRQMAYNGIDRVDNTQGYSLSNTVTCCIDCNRAKADHSVEYFKGWIRQAAAILVAS